MTGRLIVLIFVLVSAIPCLNADEAVPGLLRTRSGMLYRGMCETGADLNPLNPGRVPGLSVIDEQYRRVFVSSRNCDPVIPDQSVLPNVELNIPQRRTGRRMMPQVIGAVDTDPFTPDGTRVHRLRMSNSEVMEVTVGISRLTVHWAEVQGLSHHWTYHIPMKSIPDDLLYPGLVERAAEFGDGLSQLNIVRLLTDADKFRSADRLNQAVAAENPDLKEKCDLLSERMRSRFAGLVIEELKRMEAVGQYRTAARAAALYPSSGLSAQVRVDAAELIRNAESAADRISSVSAALNQQLAMVADPDTARECRYLVRDIIARLSRDNIDRLAAFELFLDAEDVTPRDRIALAVTGMLLGSDNAVQGYSQAQGLQRIEGLARDYLTLRSEPESERSRLLTEISGTEGYSPERVSLLLARMAPPDPLDVSAGSENAPAAFRIEESDEMPRAVGMLPPEYSDDRRCPLLVAFPREHVGPEETLAWWAPQAARRGFIVVVPQIFQPADSEYGGADSVHRRVLQLIRHLKYGLSIDDEMVFAAGHGIGGEAAVDLGAAHPNVFSGVISVGGLGRRHIQLTGRNQPGPAWYIVVGDRQGFWMDRWELSLTRLFRRVAGSAWLPDATLVVYPERGFEPYPEEVDSIFDWMELHPRQSLPTEISADSCRSSEQLRGWIELTGLPDVDPLMDQPHRYDTIPDPRVTVEARITGDSSIIVSRCPCSASILLSPELPGLDLTKPLRIRGRGRTATVDFSPDLRDMLDAVAASGERTRFVWQRIPVPGR